MSASSSKDVAPQIAVPNMWLMPEELVDEVSSSDGGGDDLMGLIAEANVQKWRVAHFFEDDFDFAYAFDSWSDALSVSRPVAEAWRDARAKAESDAAKDGQSVYATAAGHSRLEPDVTRASFLRRRDCTKSLARGIDTALEKEKADPDVKDRVSGLIACMSVFGALKEDSQQDADGVLMWQQAVERQAWAVVKNAEPVTVYRAMKTWDELSEFMAEHKLDVGGLSRTSLESFVHSSSGPSRAFTSLRWMCKHLELPLPMAKVKPPKSQAKGVLGFQSDQAPVAEPILLGALEEAIIDAWTANNPRVLALMGLWWQCFGNMRAKHLKRSLVLRISKSLCHSECTKGKQQVHRDGFDWAVPTTFVTQDFNWAEKLFLPMWESLSPEQQQMCGMIFDAELKRPLSNECMIQEARRALAHLVEEASLVKMTTYSWRRISTTVGLSAKFNPVELCALGDWQEPSQLQKAGVAAVPLRYAGQKYNESLRVKTEFHSIMTRIWAHDTWEAVPQSSWQEQRGLSLEPVAKAIEQDKVTIFESPRLEARSANRIRLTARQGPNVMPEIEGKLLAPKMRNGNLLCAAFQLGPCKDSCPYEHRCAALLKSGRVCGDPKHGAATCQTKKALLPAELPMALFGSDGQPESESKRQDQRRSLLKETQGIPPDSESEHSDRGRSRRRNLKKDQDRDRRSSKASSRKRPSAQDRDRPRRGDARRARQAEKAAANSAQGASASSSTRQHGQKRRSEEPAVQEIGKGTSKSARLSADACSDPGASASSSAVQRGQKRRGDELAGQEAQRVRRDLKPNLNFEYAAQFDAKYDELAALRWKRKGSSKSGVEPPCKCPIPRRDPEGPEPGSIWVGGLPTETNRRWFEENRVTLVVTCFAESALTREVREQGRMVKGWIPDSCYVVHVVVGCEKERSEQFREALRIMAPTLEAGESVLIHCMAGVHRAPVITAASLSHFLPCSFDEAVRHVQQVRATELSLVLRDSRLASWARSMTKPVTLARTIGIDEF